MKYERHAANAYPKLVDEIGLLRRALKISHEMLTSERRKEKAEIECIGERVTTSGALLRDLGEAS